VAHAAIACGWTATNAAEPVTNRPMTAVTAKTLRSISTLRRCATVAAAHGRIVDNPRRHWGGRAIDLDCGPVDTLFAASISPAHDAGLGDLGVADHARFMDVFVSGSDVGDRWL
jgi:hypothetical protein